MRDSVFHRGEQSVQARLGVRGIEQWARKVVRPWMPDQHRAFYTSLPFLVVTARDGDGRPWTTLLAGGEGFTRSVDARTLDIGAVPVPGDALEHAFTQPTDLGMLGIEFSTRRRNRVNGSVVRTDEGLRFSVGQSFGNCPQYIHPRQWVRVVPSPGPPRRSTQLSAAQQAWVRAADTCFIGSGHRGSGESPTFGMDASHRGGDPGFVQVLSASQLAIPDYAGNNHFNTIGNLVVDPRASLLFVDFHRGSLLQLSGRASIDWDSDEVAKLPGAQRRIVFDIDAVVELPEALGLRWHDEHAMAPAQVVAKVPQSADVTSFELAPIGRDALPFSPGQHLPIAVTLPERGRVERTYSLSRGPGHATYRISVKREPQGLVSRALHDTVSVGDRIEVGAPRGSFVLQGEHTAVLLSAGVGVTPLLAMMHVLAASPQRRVVFAHAARNGAHHPFEDEVQQLATRHGNTDIHVVYSEPRSEDRRAAGRMSAADVYARANDPHADYFLCGPPGFMAAMQEGLEACGVPEHQIHAESFGPARLPTP
jgi:ferredoxin-NADP reductase/predicted pyridoxine 5'-phosphate oxidase superfamily flavin-nucleotide-binding protein